MSGSKVLTPRQPPVPPSGRPPPAGAGSRRSENSARGSEKQVALPPIPAAGTKVSSARQSDRGLLTRGNLNDIRGFITANKNISHRHRRGNLCDRIPDAPFKRVGPPCDAHTGLALEALQPHEPAIDVILRFRIPQGVHAPPIVEPLTTASQVERLFAFMKGQNSGNPSSPRKTGESLPEESPRERGPKKPLRHRDYELRAFAARRAGQRRQEALAFFSMATLSYSATDFTKAAGHLDRCIAIFEELEDATGLASVHNLAGAAHFRAGDYERSVYHHRKQEALSSSFGQAIAQINVGVCYSAMKDREAAVDILTEAVDNARQSGDMCAESIALGNLGLAHLKSGNLKGAQMNLEGCMEMCSLAGDHTGAAACLLLLGEVYALVHDHKHAQFYFANAFRVASDGGARDIAQVARVNLGVAIGNEQYRERCSELASVMSAIPSTGRLLGPPG